MGEWFWCRVRTHFGNKSKSSKSSFTGSTATGRMVMQYATENIIPVTLELGGKSPNIFFPSVMDADDEFLTKHLKGWFICTKSR